jgi:hypothetical protein
MFDRFRQFDGNKGAHGPDYLGYGSVESFAGGAIVEVTL